MQHRPDNSGPFLLSLAIHAGFLASLWLVTMSCDRFNAFVERARLPDWFALQCSRPVSVAGPVIEASLVSFTPKAQPLPKVARTAPPVPKPTPAKPEPKPEVIERKPLDSLPAQDTVNQEKIDKLALEKAEAEREQEEKRKREQEHVLIFADRVERRSAAGTQVFPFSALERIDAKITTFQNSGNSYHSYRLPFGALGLVTIETNTHEGVDGETGRLLMRVSGKPMQPWT